MLLRFYRQVCVVMVLVLNRSAGEFAIVVQVDITWILAMTSLAACTASGPVVISDTDHQVNVLTATEDSKPLSVLVRQALRNNGQTVTSQIHVSQDSADTVKLSGFVNDDAIRYEAERVAYQVEGVRFVVNNLALRN